MHLLVHPPLIVHCGIVHVCTRALVQVAEEYSTDGIISGILTARYLASGGRASGIAAGPSAIARGKGGGLVDGVGRGEYTGDGYMFPAALPRPPALTTYRSPPPSPPPGEHDMVKSVMSAFSLGMGGLIMIGIGACAFLFFSQDLKRLLGLQVHARAGGMCMHEPVRVHVACASSHVHPPVCILPCACGACMQVAAIGPAASIDATSPGGLGGGGRVGGHKKKQKGGKRELSEISVTVVMPSITQTKEVRGPRAWA